MEVKSKIASDDNPSIVTDGTNLNPPNENGPSKLNVLQKQLFVKWLKESEFDHNVHDDIDDTSSTMSESASENYTSSLADTDEHSLGESLDHIAITDRLKVGHTKVVNGKGDAIVNHIDVLQHFMTGENNIQTFGNIKIEKSKNVHIGNVVHINGPIHIVNTAGNVGTIKQSNIEPPKVSGRTDGEDKVESNKDEHFIDSSNCTGIVDTVLKIVDRRTWLAQPPFEIEDLSVPVSYVVISHTASESADTQASMIYMVRNIQTYHIESRRWEDIAYNFLIGCDGSVYEGRGWNRVGAHTYGYNQRAIGISFVGTFIRTLPPKISLNACKLLIEKGISDGYITPNYKLLGHCQCSATESPGRMLFEEIQTWDHWSAEP